MVELVSNSIRRYSWGELAADGTIHLLGIAFSLIAVFLLLAFATPKVDASVSVAIAVYGLAMILLFLASAANNMNRRHEWQPVLKRFDQAAIFMKIAGTYTPLVVLLGGVFAYGVLAIIWIAALGGAIGKLAFGQRFDRISVALYLPLGWASVLLLWPMALTLPVYATVLVVAGGLLYTVGVIFHVWEQLKFQNAIWHAFVLAASVCHFSAISTAAFAAAG